MAKNYNRGDQNAPSNRDANAQGSRYAASYGAQESIKIQKITQKLIFDSSKKRFFDLKILGEIDRENVPSDEFTYQEMGYQRDPITVAASSSSAAVQSITVANIDSVAENMVLIYPDNSRGNVISKDEASSVIKVSAQTGETLPAVSAGDDLAVGFPVEADGVDGFAYNFRAGVVERYNFVQLFSKSMTYGKVELFKHEKAGTTSNFLSMERKAMNDQMRIDISNAVWNGKRGEVTLANGDKAKMMGGIYPTMVEAGSPHVECDLSTIREAFEEAIVSSEYGDYGQVRYAFMEDRLHLALCKAYGKGTDSNSLVRYTPDTKKANLVLDSIELGSSTIVFVPYKRFEDSASFPKMFRDLIFIVDFANMKLCSMWGEMSGETNEGRDKGGSALRKTIWQDANYSLKFHNPLGCATVKVNR